MGDSTTRDRQELEEYKDEAYFEGPGGPRVFDSRLLRGPVALLPTRKPLVFSRHHSVTEAMRAMQGEHRGVVLITEDGTAGSPVLGIFTERDVLFRIVDGGRNPAVLPLSAVMTPAPESLRDNQSIAEVLNMMSVGGFRHVPVVDDRGHPVSVVSVRDVVQFLVESFPKEILNLGASHPRQREGG